MRARFPAPFGGLTVRVDEGGRVVRVRLSAREEPERIDAGVPNRVVEAFRAYLSGSRRAVDVEVGALDVSAFQREVLEEASRVPPGRTVTYGELAERVGRTGAGVAVGQALAANPVPVVYPCHRVVSRDGLGGFMGEPEGRGPAIKRWLLEHEGALTAGASSGQASS